MMMTREQAWEDYQEAKKQAKEAFEEAVKPARKAYEEGETSLETYQKATKSKLLRSLILIIRPARATYDEALKQAEEAYNKAAKS